MRLYRVCIESYLSNNSDLKEYNNYYLEEKTYEKASELAKKYIKNWNEKSDGVIYNIYDITPNN